jgi:hypothetical protein
VKISLSSAMIFFLMMICSKVSHRNTGPALTG